MALRHGGMSIIDVHALSQCTVVTHQLDVSFRYNDEHTVFHSMRIGMLSSANGMCHHGASQLCNMMRIAPHRDCVYIVYIGDASLLYSDEACRAQCCGI